MQILVKSVELGEMKFKVGTDRDIAVKCFNEFPELLEKIKEQEEVLENKSSKMFDETVLELSDYILEELPKFIKFALPLMLEKAGDNSNAEEIIKYAQDNNATEIMNVPLMEFVAQGFTQRKLAKPKIKFSMK
jgi:hypothetical protein